ncbi:LysR family transcriptional regulator [Mesorhizobium sp. RMAD-H1]|uniref:LysR family transcriptional regulator n=1 Tax=Mesorhizobium sp. RMAD-H1 TaxID=2587065 RepID=UPI00161FD58B|nr:LysR family transcriptional regulator [Mesorhizobium sp. RMAD-H1]MBB2971556.1 DNA-binding transcriptional LysR family regulator [Mesorhizobium sp. RMAD-H1]
MQIPRFSLRQIGYFLAIAEAGSIRGASERLNISQTALSQALTELEEELGTPLLARRRSHGANLTAAGVRLLGEARAVLDAAGDLYSAAHGWEQGLTGRLTVGCYTTMAPLLVPRLFSGFRERHPAIDLELMEGSTDEIRAELRAGICELALLYEFGLGDDVERERLYELRPHLVLQENHRLAGEKEIDLRDIAHEPFILFEVPPAASNTFEVFAQAGVQPRIAYRTSNFELARTLAARGLAYTMLIQKPAAPVTYDGSRVVTRYVSGVGSRYPVVLAWSRSAKLTRRAEAFRSFCREVMAEPYRAENS